MRIPAILSLTVLIPALQSQERTHEMSDPDVLAIAQLQGKSQQIALRALLAGDLHKQEDPRNYAFYYEDRLRPALRSLLTNRKVGKYANDSLALIGAPDDVGLLVQRAPELQRRFSPYRCAYHVATALLDPRSEEEWAFLGKCAISDYTVPGADAGAIQTLMLIASPRSREILEEAQSKNPRRADLIAKALKYVQRNPLPLVSQNLRDLTARVARAIQIGDWDGKSEPLYNEAGDKVLMSFRFETYSDFYFYSATLHKTDDGWKLRGVRATGQALKARPKVAVP